MMTRPLIAAVVLACGVALPIAAAPITYATRGVVAAVSATEIVVARPRNRGPITIALAAATHVDGSLVVGATVSVRYHDAHGHHVATAVTVEPPPH